ncbi:GRB2-associated-binding protein 1-like isoform X3 [Dreissena polymorpha]|nr:GRB2-associated-binding protein 1-like isoform X3 [Dreissena polymorpha]
MSTWVRNLCSVCGMKPDESKADSPKPSHRETPPSRHATKTMQPHGALPASAVGVMTKPPASLSSTTPTARSPPSSATVRNMKPVSSTVKAAPAAPVATLQEEYIPLETCSSGPTQRRTNRQESISSVPDELAPPPPPFKHADDVFDQTYDVPPPSYNSTEEVNPYNRVPKPRPLINSQEPYDIPPAIKNCQSTPRSSSDESQRNDSAYSSQSTYDVPPPGRISDSPDEVYDIPPSHSHPVVSMAAPPPSRPPKPGHLQTGSSSQEAYMNLPTNSKVFSDKSSKMVNINSVVAPPPHLGMVLPAAMASVDLNEMYDFPKQYNGDTNDQLLMSTPPPPSSCSAGVVEHKYFNAQGGVVDAHVQDMYLPMETVTTQKGSFPRKSSSTDNEVEYTDMSGKSSFDDSFESRQTIYDHPPPSRPAVPPPRPEKPSGNFPEKQDTYSIFSTSRTRSFKKKNEASPRVARKTPPASSLTKPGMVALPSRSDHHHPDFSTSDEDDDDMGTPKIWENVPPAPANKDSELKYVDLDHDDTVDKEPMRSPHATATAIAHTEYHEIDFVKTDALRNVKETVCETRNKEKNNT